MSRKSSLWKKNRCFTWSETIWQRYKIFINIHIGRYFISYAIGDVHKLSLSLFLLMNLPLIYHIFCILSLTVNTCSKQFQTSCWIQFYLTVFSTARIKWKIWCIYKVIFLYFNWYSTENKVLCILLVKKWSFPLKIFPINVTKSPGNGGFGNIYWTNP